MGVSFYILLVVSPIKNKGSICKSRVICVFCMPVSDNFQHIKDSYLIYLLFGCYAMFKLCPSVHNVPNGQHRTPNIRNTMTCIDMITAFENSSILFLSTCKVLVQT